MRNVHRARVCSRARPEIEGERCLHSHAHAHRTTTGKPTLLVSYSLVASRGEPLTVRCRPPSNTSTTDRRAPIPRARAATGRRALEGVLADNDVRSQLWHACVTRLRTETLRTYFGGFGEVTEVRIMFDRGTGKPRGFGFVVFADAAAAEKAAESTCPLQQHLGMRTASAQRTTFVCHLLPHPRFQMASATIAFVGARSALVFLTEFPRPD